MRAKTTSLRDASASGVSADTAVAPSIVGRVPATAAFSRARKPSQMPSTTARISRSLRSSCSW